MKSTQDRGSKMKTENKAILYVRVSTTEQAEKGVSLEAQEKSLRAYCEMRGLEIAELVIDAGVSAGKPLASRPGGEKIIEAIKTKKVDLVVAWKLDRLFRDCVDCLTATSAWEKKGVALHLVDLGGQSVDTTSSTGRFFLTMLAAMAEMERNRIRERTASAMQYKKEKGEYCGGSAPYGWRVSEDGINLESHNIEQEIIRAAHELRNEGMSLLAVGGHLEKSGMLPRNGKKWHAETVKSVLKAVTA